MRERLYQFVESLGTRDVVEIAILAVALFFILRSAGQDARRRPGPRPRPGDRRPVSGRPGCPGRFDLTVLGRMLDYLLTTALLGLIVIFQPELRRGLMVLGRYRVMQLFVNEPHHPVADKLADAAESMSRECVGGADRHRARPGADRLHRDGRGDRRRGFGAAAAFDLLQAQPVARRSGDSVRRPARRGCLPVTARVAARRSRPHWNASPGGPGDERGNRRGAAGGQ